MDWAGFVGAFFFFNNWVGTVQVEAKRWAVFGLGQMCLRFIRSGRSHKWLKKGNRGI